MTGGRECRIAVVPGPVPQEVADSVRQAGGRVVPVADDPVGLIWLGEDPGELRRVLHQADSVRWVQLPDAGIQPYLELMGDGRAWSCARGVYGPPVAEHALMLALACLKDVTASARAGAWHPRPTVQLSGAEVVVFGGGAIARSLLNLLVPFDVRVSVLRRTRPTMDVGPCAGEVRVLGPDAIDDVVPRARVLFLAAPLTAGTRGLVNRRRLRMMRPDSCLVNVARGELVVTDDLVDALRLGWIAGAGLDVTDPEPLPAGHPLWRLPGCLITAHSAADRPGVLPRFAELVKENVQRLLDGSPPRGLVDPAIGY
ncbi:hydroxyacid dehydrogenase [Amycolatopsis sp. H6(2020)]|nr:hydroxyacid dehydrogenase [Amycolatopsis sp. H6(2020)]